ncbi:MAG TPA: putative toxin-antitoxin system toxin component, PIN family [Xanthomonadaceae bacterium]|jgi:putative PIN family toxin of toxin-antitoxin system|nr:putative toxin-antitoxin system toxin component, PIN family [Xanthomonadaceae bacterium]
MKLVLDTDVIVAALRSPAGASAELLRLARKGRVALAISVPLFLEYEAQCTLREHRTAAGLTLAQARLFVDTLAVICEPVVSHYLWRPQLRDPGDEMVLEAAINGGVDALATFNHRDFGDAPSRFGVELLFPSDALRRIKLKHIEAGE